MNDRILITGGFGYVGGRLASAIGRVTDYEPRLGTRQVDAQIPDWLVRGDVCLLDLQDDASLIRACRGCDCVIHLAATNEIESAEDPEKAFIVNSLGTLKLLGASVAAGVPNFIYFSTAHVYGSPLTGTITEEALPRPVHPYAITHKAAEDFVLAAHDKKEINGLVLRLSNSFGAPVHPEVNRWTLLVNDLCRQAVTERTLTLRSSGLQLRDFIPMSDVEKAVIHFLTPGCDWQDGLFNLGGANPVSVLSMSKLIAERCQAILGFQPEMIVPQTDENEIILPLDYRIDKIEGAGFKLSGSITDEIDETLRFCHTSFGKSY